MIHTAFFQAKKHTQRLQCFTGRIAGADFTYLIGSHQRATMLLTTIYRLWAKMRGVLITTWAFIFMDARRASITSGGSAFLHHVTRIIGRCSQKQMCWINTCGSVTAMAYKQSVRNWPICKFVRKTVCRYTSSVADIVASIAAWEALFHPQPAGFGFVDAFPERCDVFWQHGMSP